ncbi:transporter substrate-binding domain-containing protein, partial [bacterium]|nr:transporter substrate-binding domain-containing protein [bacterium]
MPRKIYRKRTPDILLKNFILKTIYLMNNFRLTYLIVLLLLGMNLIAGIAPAHATAIGDGSVSLTPEEVEWLKKHPVITLAPDPDFHPIEFFDAQGKYKGISADYTALLEEKLGIEFKTVNLKRWDKVLEQAKGRKVDMFGAATKSPQREEYMLFAEPHIEFPGVFLTRSGNGDTYTMKQLQGLRVAVVSGYIWQDLIEKDYPEMDLYLVPDIKSGLEEVSLGTVDVFINDIATASYYIEQSGITSLRISGETGYFTRLAFASRSDWPILNGILQKALAQISPAEIAAIYKKWVHLDQHGWKPTREFIAILTAALLLLSVAGILLWNWILKRQIAYQTDEMKLQ